MDVTCERCGTEYEFDETLLSGRGTSVKCTNCGHVFKVYPKAHEDVDRATSTWRLMRRDGTVDTINSLRELQQRIGSGELIPTDQISRGAEGFKALGSIPELETFFHAAGGGGSQPGPPSPVPPAPTESKPISSRPPGRRPRQPTLLGVVPVPKPVPVDEAPGSVGTSRLGDEVGNENVTAPVEVSEHAVSPYQATDSIRLPETEDTGTSDPVHAPGSESMRLPEAADESMETSTPATGSFSLPDESGSSSNATIEDAEFDEPTTMARRGSTPPPGYYDDDEDIPELPGRGWSPTRWLIVIVVVGGLTVVGTQWQRVTEMFGFAAAPEASAAAIEEGDAALAEDHLEAYERAITLYGQAIQVGDENDPKLLIKAARANALAAQAIDDGAAAPGSDASRKAHAKAALNFAEQALMIDAEVLDARLAEADALRLLGDTSRARESLERGRLMPFSRTAEFFRIDALLEGAEHQGKLEAGLLSASRAAEIAPDGIRYRLLLARAQLASGDEPRARTQIDAVLTKNPHHPAAAALLTQLDAVVVPVEDAGVTDAGAAPDAAIPTQDASLIPPTEANVDASVNAAADETADETGIETGNANETATATPTKKPAPDPARKKRPSRSRERPQYDEYDRLAQAAGSDAFVDGRPPLRDFSWYMREGEAALAGGDYVKARAFFESALEARPGSGDATDALGRTALGSGDAELSLRYFRSAAQRGHPDGYYNLGRAYEKLGRGEEAISAYYTYLKRRPSGVHVSAARTAIKKLDPRVKLPDSETEAAPEPESEPSSEPPTEPEVTTP